MNDIKGYYLMPHPPIIIPEIGGEEIEKIQATTRSMKRVANEIKEIEPQIILVITPHGPLFSDAVAISELDGMKGSFGAFGYPEVNMSVDIDKVLTEKIAENAIDEDIPVVKLTEASIRKYNLNGDLDHGAMVPLYFINQEYTNYKLVHITYGLLSKLELYRFGMAIKKAVEEIGERVVIVASGDLSHRLCDSGPYEYHPLGKVFDEKLLELLRKGATKEIINMDEYMTKSAGECALHSIHILLGILDGSSYESEILSYEGPFGVGYGIAKVMVKDKHESLYKELIEERQLQISQKRANENPYVKLARESLEYYLNKRSYLKLPDYVKGEMLTEQRGVFVSLKKNGNLRGCIGTIEPVTDSVAEEIIRNAVEAGFMDPRFNAVDQTELDDIVYSVDVLMPAEKSEIKDLDPHKYGVIVRKGGRAGLLLPNLEGVDTVEEQIDIVLKKAGIQRHEEFSVERFEVIRYK